MPRCLFILLSVGFFAASALAGEVIYKYVDDEGTTVFTEQWHRIPPQYIDRVQSIDPLTGQPYKAPPAPLPPKPRAAPLPVAPAAPAPAAEKPFYAAWLEQFSKLAVPLPSRYQLGVGAMAFVLIFGAFKIMRLSSNLLVKVMLKGIMLLILAASAYAMYVSGLNERISAITHDPAQQSITGKELIREGQTTVDQAKKALDQAAAPIQKFKELTIDEVSRTVEKANASNKEMIDTLEKIEPTR